ncbi:hypothetical protein BX600DRAFT_512324 [Xylariales sp. PMI_506]|nr:hypothetical protein BX600DRAFT_512324 [Xylariales sp. PMI_506]
MDKGLDELIEWLLTKIGFSGLDGFSALDLVKSIKAFYNEDGDAGEALRHPDPDAISSLEVNATDISHASRVWKWLLARKDIIVEPPQCARMSLEEVISPATGNDETETAPPSEATSKTDAHDTRTTKQSSSTFKSIARLHLSEERLWKTIAGHGPDLKRIPQFEWRALVAIASVQEEGILQGDLVRLTGQDKRSLPTRTDALARKGYIIKQPYMLRGCRTSKLWLTQFAESAKEEEHREGLPLGELDLSKATLTKNWDPISFSHYYNGARVDYLAIAQAFLAVLDAYGAMRYCDLRTKLDVNEKVPQMRGLAKSARWFAKIGAIRFEPMQSRSSNKVFKDCLKFIRQPTPEEWKKFRVTPKANLKIPSSRVRNNSQKKVSQAKSTPSTPTKSDKAKAAAARERAIKERLYNSPSIRLSAWTPYKPMINTIFDIIKRAGEGGSSNADIGTLNLGYAYRKWISTLTTLISLPRSHPAHLHPFAVVSQLNRIGKTNTYKFFASTALSVPGDHSNNALLRDSSGPLNNEQHRDPLLVTDSTPLSGNSFPIPRVKFIRAGASIAVLAQGSSDQARSVGVKHRPASEEKASAAATEPIDETLRQIEPVSTEPESQPGPVFPTAEENIAEEQRQEELARPPGVYFGKPNSLAPFKTLGRPKKSIVLIFKLPALGDPKIFNGSKVGCDDGNMSDDGQTDHPAPPVTLPESNMQIVSEATNGRVAQARRGRKGTTGSAKPFKCDKCGNSWKNPGGLEYHQSKSQSACNPAWVPPPPKPATISPLTSKQTRQGESESMAQETHVDGIKENMATEMLELRNIAKNALPSRRPQLVKSTTAAYVKESGNSSRNITLNSVPLHNVSDLLATPTKARATSAFDATPVQNASATPRNVSYNQESVPSGIQIGSEQVDMRMTDCRETELMTAEAASHAPQPSPGENGQKKAILSTITNPPSAKSSKKSSKLPDTIAPKDPAKDLSLSNLSKEANKDVKAVTPRSKSISAAVKRRERTTDIVQRILNQTGGAFPGEKPLHAAIVALWNQDFTDISPPDLKLCQNILKRMADNHIIEQHFSGFIDKTTAMKTISIVSQVAKDPVTAAAIAKRIKEIKDKSIELFPDPYFPPEFIISRQHTEEALGTYTNKHRVEAISSDSLSEAQIEAAGKAVPTLGYEMPNERTVKTRLSTENTAETPRLKRTRQSVRELAKIRSPTSRKRRRTTKDQDAMPNREPNTEWPHQVTYLQDFTTGTWSLQSKCIADGDSGDDTLSHESGRRFTNARTGRRRHHSHPQLPRTFEDCNVLDSSSDVNSDNIHFKPSLVRFLQPQTTDTFVLEPEANGEDDESENDDDNDNSQVLSAAAVIEDITSTGGVPINGESYTFAPIQRVKAIADGVWPTHSLRSFADTFNSGLTMVGSFPDPVWTLRQNLPQTAEEMAENHRQMSRSRTEPSTAYEKFTRDVVDIEGWEISDEGTYLQALGTVAPAYIFISLRVDSEHVSSIKPLMPEWRTDFQYTATSLPDEIKYAQSSEDSTDLFDTGIVNDMPRKRRRRRRGEGKLRRFIKRADGNWKTRTLCDVPRRDSVRWNKHRAVGDNLGRNGETELLVAIILVRKLVGGVDKLVDWGLIIKIYPMWSLSGLKRFWTRLSKERANYIDAFSRKFESAFLEAYESGEIPPLDYDDLENYEWKTLIGWAAKLQTHDGVELPKTRKRFDSYYALSEPKNSEENWREAWYGQQSSVFIRLDGAASAPVTVPATKPPSAFPSLSDEDVQLAKSWVRALCNNSNRSTVGNHVRDALLQRGNHDKEFLNNLLEVSVTKLLEDKVISRVYGKGFGQVFKLNNIMEKRAEKYANLEKFIQATTFKAEMDESFRNNKPLMLTYNANDGAIMAMINLQAYGKIRLEEVDFPHVPFGFEPCNYEGRKYPKKYYQFDVKLVPTEKYLYDADLAIVNEAASLEVPHKGRGGEIPIWYDFFDNLDRSRWVQYLCMVTFALAVKGPLDPKSAVELLSPVVEAFEAELIMEWLDRVGLLERMTGGHGCTVGEWWWLVVGKLAAQSGKVIASE